MKILKEAAPTSSVKDIKYYTNTFNDLLIKSDFASIVELLKDYGITQLQMNKTEWDKFVDTNYGALIPEFKQYSFELNNPYIKFIQTYQRKNTNLNAFSQSPINYKCIHDLVGDGVLTTKQIAFTAPEKEQMSILLNTNIYEQDLNTLIFIIKTVVWFIDNERNLNNYIINRNIKAAFSSKARKKLEKATDNTKENNEKVTESLTEDIDSIKNLTAEDLTLTSEDLYHLRKATIFTDLVIKVNEDPNISIYDASQVSEISTKPQAVNIIENQLKLLHTTVQESGRDPVTGRYQDKETVDETNNRNNIDVKSVNRALSKVSKYNLANTLKNLNSNLSPSEWGDLFDSLSNMYDIIRKLK